MRSRLLNSLLYFPARRFAATPAELALDHRELEIETDDGELLHGWWMPAGKPRIGHLLLCHGNAGNVGDRLVHAALLTEAGFDVLLFDYRGYGRSSGRPSEQGTYMDARAARRALLEQAETGANRLYYLGESLGGAVALDLALESPPAGLVLQSTFTSVREVGRLHYPFVPAALIPDAYPSRKLIPRLRAPLLVLHGERDDIVPVSHGRALFEAAPEPKRLRTFPARGHNDLEDRDYAEVVASWAAATAPSPRSPRSGST